MNHDGGGAHHRLLLHALPTLSLRLRTPTLYPRTLGFRGTVATPRTRETENLLFKLRFTFRCKNMDVRTFGTFKTSNYLHLLL